MAHAAATTATRMARARIGVGNPRWRVLLRTRSTFLPQRDKCLSLVDGRGESWFTSSRMPYRPTERTEQRNDAEREGILRAALDHVAEGGYASATIQRVAVRAGVATGTVYRHFPSKSELFA